jgi:general secretion pathway protein H
VPTIARRQAGFTLLEMIAVIAILGLVLGLVGLRGPTRSARLDLDVAVRELAGSLQLARSRAIVQNRSVEVTLDRSSYSLDGAAPRPLLATVVAANHRTITFSPPGGSSGGIVTLQVGDRRVAVQAAWLTGHVSIVAAP